MSAGQSTGHGQAIVNTQTSPLIMSLATRWQMTSATMINTIKATVMKDTKNISDAQLMMFLQVAHEYDLNPFLKELYAFPTKDNGIVPMVPVDGWARIVNRQKEFDGVKFVDDWEMKDGVKTGLVSTTCIIFRKDRTHPTEVTEYMQECCIPSKEPWRKWPARMLRHKAFIQCARIAFSLSGIYDPDEAERISEGGPHDDKARVIERPKTIEAHVSIEPKAEASVQTQPAQTDSGSTEAANSAKVEPEAQVKQPATEAAPADTTQPTGAELFPPRAEDKGLVEYCTVDQLKKLFVVAKAAWPKEYAKSDAAGVQKLHEFLDFEYGIKSLKQIPVEKREEIVDKVSKEIAKQKK